ncbi:Thiol peroxidase, Bcp-type [hydrothermal vent metagenome]|uniref:thioredoxin-dependent peroxiredoxin n=1 Tax=hydrothermal vent metagenome TaxID=652676 RepID=A0A3B0YKZ1_9ZZZZ
MNKKAEIGKSVPAFNLPATGEQKIRLSALKGQKVILYFYPKDATPGCTQEGLDFTTNIAKFKRQNALVFGISRDNMKSHEKFKENQKYKLDLISDEDEVLCEIFDVIKMKNMYGKQVRGIERSTFLIDEKGKLCNEWRKVKVPGHVEQVLEATKLL